jgi:hypothetical protein
MRQRAAQQEGATTMTLADVCSDFVAFHAQEGWPLAEDLQLLADEVEHYSKPPWDYPPEQLAALRRAIERAKATKQVDPRSVDDEKALLWLFVLAECIRHYHDSMTDFFLTRGSDIDKWCANQLRESDAVEARRFAEELRARMLACFEITIVPVSKMLTDAVTKERLITWALGFVHGHSRNARKAAWGATQAMIAAWREAIFPEVVARLEAQRKADAGSKPQNSTN